jgi:hypothetical protein
MFHVRLTSGAFALAVLAVSAAAVCSPSSFATARTSFEPAQPLRLPASLPHRELTVPILTSGAFG